jgi:hypothetical protein
LKANGRRIYFHSDLSGKSQDIYFVERPTLGQPFGAPLTVGGVSGPAFNEMSPVLSADELTIYFARTAAYSANPAKIFVATRAAIGDSFGTATAVPELDSGTTDNFPTYLTEDGCVLYMARAPAVGTGPDLFVAKRPL